MIPDPSQSLKFSVARRLTNFKFAASSSNFLDLIKVQLHRGGASENGYHDAQRRAVVVNLVDRAGEILEWPVSNLDGLAFVEPELRFGVLGRHLDAVQDAVHVIRGEGNRGRARTQESRDPRRGSHQVPGVVAHL